MSERYPGSKKKIGHREKVDAEVADWEKNPRIYTVMGQDVEFFTIGQLAMALNRRPVTIRKWESEGIIPRALFSAPSKDVRGKWRLYTRSQVEAMIRIAREEGILYDHTKHIRKTDFQRKVLEAFKRMGKGKAA